MLSRARKLDSLILVGLSPQVRALLEAGPPAYIRQKIHTLQAKSIRTLRRAECLASDMNLSVPAEWSQGRVSRLGWPCRRASLPMLFRTTEIGEEPQIFDVSQRFGVALAGKIMLDSAPR